MVGETIWNIILICKCKDANSFVGARLLFSPNQTLFCFPSLYKHSHQPRLNRFGAASTRFCLLIYTHTYRVLLCTVLLMYLSKKLWIEIISYFNLMLNIIKGYFLNFFASENNILNEFCIPTHKSSNLTWTEFGNSGFFPITRVGLFNLFFQVDTQYLEKNPSYYGYFIYV